MRDEEEQSRQVSFIETYNPPTPRVLDKINFDTEEQDGKYQAINRPKDLHGIVPHEEIRNIFVEMCVFARMGFIHPPSCLQCAYKSCEWSDSCDNLVVWRRRAGDDNDLLQPIRLGGNILFVKCSIAQAWMRGEEAAGKKWDKKKKHLVDLLDTLVQCFENSGVDIGK
mmetsp:Transcript_4546/g.6637  ORF Transcript_4546/g.6637 Transcript_4546/m.6637 type:complete len:168 (-) Transcript_4546:205-708(-)